ncbi:na pi-cotransporter family protein [Leptolyngbya sp. Heron Island J]|uniref:Na/Pi cotransporter family protein n=1 Tax=Leptolyngbya sp. Heron Island J TaxID=1385935 RepID=UPI0003B98757|nr:Na/Pi symporter [Leptolyngbya sp. Heron Island J]ESA34187.1 na pi-cotransporter family protein [Leptolyngbya sp. Heron Island J]
MTTTVIHAIGGLGLFLLGMIVMTDGLRVLAGNAMRRALMRFTGNAGSGVLTGAIATAILQSSSATTVATVGFVSAGLISFSGALGIIFGANIGSTFTGWVVAILGFKLKLGTAVLPLLFIGASLKLFTKGRWASFGYAIAGFGLIFVGITSMQDAMGTLDGLITPEQLPMDTLIGRLQLVALGILATIITQASSVGVAATLTALYAGAINFEQAAALVIGMDVGTTITAIIATLGGSVNARRTGLSHVVYNIWTAGLALTLITPYTTVWQRLAPGQLIQNAEIALVAFHTCFNLVGVTTILPFTQQFARLIMRLVPGKDRAYTDTLSDGLLEQPDLALNAAQSAIQTELLLLLRHVSAILGDPHGQRGDLIELQTALDETHAYLDQIHLKTGAGPNWDRLVSMMHALDHLQRIHERCEEDEDRAKTAQATLELMAEKNLLIDSIQKIMMLVQAGRWQAAADQARTTSSQIHHKVEPYRATTITQAAVGQIDVLTSTERLEAIRWLRRVSKHIRRITDHMSQAVLAVGQ